MATKKDRQRQLARERHHRRLAREAERQARTRQLTRWVSAGAVVVVLAVVVTLTALHLNNSSAASPAHSPSASASASPSASPTASPSPTASESVSASGTVQCTYTKAGKAARNVGTPPATASVRGHYQATITTNRGTIVIDLLAAKAPCTVHSFAYLAAKKFFNRTPCQRLTTSNGVYVLQCGDPTGTGSGGPGYEFANENLTGATYPAGTVAMANVTGEPSSNGSQFFMVYKDTAEPPDYTPFGTIVSGLNVLRGIAKAGSDNSSGPGDGHPKEKVTIESVVVKKT
ncbi:MAG TPA: peptidylprolyl isomerase [Streptosporangiaceae bacterium]|nr:peptidylprolyl isomerase [Streptosporangiaceae bacterium]